MAKKIPQRTCVGCNMQKEKKELLRIVRNKEGEVAADVSGRMQGRGAYLCKNVECLEKAIKSKRLERTLETTIPMEVYENIRGVMIDQ